MTYFVSIIRQCRLITLEQDNYNGVVVDNDNGDSVDEVYDGDDNIEENKN